MINENDIRHNTLPYRTGPYIIGTRYHPLVLGIHTKEYLFFLDRGKNMYSLVWFTKTTYKAGVTVHILHAPYGRGLYMLELGFLYVYHPVPYHGPCKIHLNIISTQWQMKCARVEENMGNHVSSWFLLESRMYCALVAAGEGANLNSRSRSNV